MRVYSKYLFVDFCFPFVLGAFAKFRKATVSMVMSLCLSVYPSAWNNSAAAGRT